MTEVKDLENIKGFRVVSLNVCSLRHKFIIVKDLIAISDVCFLNESWLDQGDLSGNYEVEGYQQIRLDRSNGPDKNKKGGGLLLYVKDTIDMILLTDLTYITANLEIITIEMRFKYSKNIILFGVYRPPSAPKNSAYSVLSDILADVNIALLDVIIVGDFNLDYGCRSSKRLSGIGKFQTQFSLTQYITMDTFHRINYSAILDHIYTTSPNISASGVINLNISDHLPIYMVRKHTRVKPKTILRTSRSFKTYSDDLLRDGMGLQNWDRLRQTIVQLTPDELWDDYISNVNRILDVIAPICENRKIVHKPPWYTPMVDIAKRDARVSQRNFIKNPTEDNIRLKSFFRNQLIYLIRTLKMDYYVNSLAMKKKVSTEYWKEIRKVLPKSSTEKNIKLIHHKTGIQVETTILADYINEYFTGIGLELANKFTKMHSLNVTRGEINLTYDITTVEIFEIVQNIDSKKSCGITNMTSRILKVSFEYDLRHIRKIFNASLMQSKFPDLWKLAVVTPIPKKPSVNNVSDLRPISNLPLPGKMLEKLMAKRLLKYMEDSNLISNCQHGFRSSRSTGTAISCLINDIYEAINKQCRAKKPHMIYAIFIDLKKAFDTVSHELLLKKLFSLGLDNKTVNWFSDYLNNRKQKVFVNGTISNTLNVKIGVPQGSVLGPILFSIFINDLEKVVKKSNILMYADDTVLYNVDPLALQSDLLNLKKWCSYNRLTINTSKTKWMCFGGKTSNLNQIANNFIINNNKLERVDWYDYLGMRLDSGLSFVHHVDRLVSNTAYKVLTISRARKYLTIHAAMTLYKSLVLPILDYGDIFYGRCSDITLDKLQKLQNRALRMIYGIKRWELSYSITELHDRGKIMKLKARRTFHLVLYAGKLVRLGLFVNASEINTRGQLIPRLTAPRAMLPMFYHSLIYRSSKLWNGLPYSLRVTCFDNIFNIKVKNYCNIEILQK